MHMKYIKRIFIGIAIVLHLLISAYVVFVFVAEPTYKVWRPEDGVWYCEELQMQLSFEKGQKSYVVLDGRVIPCACENNRGSKDVLVFCQVNGSEYVIGDLIFSGRYVDLSDDTFVLKDRKTQQIYTFVRTN